jgi:hypothetical protein
MHPNRGSLHMREPGGIGLESMLRLEHRTGQVVQGPHAFGRLCTDDPCSGGYREGGPPNPRRIQPTALLKA